MRKIENLVFRGGGVLGVAYAGAIDALNSRGILPQIKRVAGTSSGAIFASLFCLGYSPNEIKLIAHEIDFKKFGSHWNPLRIISQYGIYRGDNFLKWIKEKIKAKTGDENFTFRDLHEKGLAEIKLFATDLNEVSVQEFSYKQTPDVKLAEALRASMSVPLFFNAWKFPDGNPTSHIYVDGGVLYVYPITCFEEDLSNTLGFFLVNNEKEVTAFRYGQLSKYMIQLYKAMDIAQTVDFEKDDLLKSVTVQIPNLGISSTDLKISKSQKNQLIDLGYKSTIAYLKNAML